MIPQHRTVVIPRNSGSIQAEGATLARRLHGHLAYLQYGCALAPGERRVDRWVFSATADHVFPREVAAALAAGVEAPLVVSKLIYWSDEELVDDWRAWTRQQVRGLPRQPGWCCWFGVLHQHPACTHVHVALVESDDARALAPIIELAARRTREVRA